MDAVPEALVEEVEEEAENVPINSVNEGLGAITGEI